MPLLALGINHQTAPVEVREQIAFDPDQLPLALTELCARGGVDEAAILSTCNRTELYCGLSAKPSSASAAETEALQVVDWLGSYPALSETDLRPYLYRHPDRQAVRHMLRVASGLDSMILGEPQILGQVKSAYQTANQAGTLGKTLERLFQHTFSVAKQVRTDTRIGESPVSVAFAAVTLSKQIFASLTKQTALMIGAGETIELVARHLFDSGIGRIIVANRTFTRARELATRFNGYAIDLAELPQHLGEADIVISSTASSSTVLDHTQVERSLSARRRRPMFMVDIAVPRDIDPRVAQLDDVYLYTVDDLQGIIDDNLRSRQAAALQAEEIIDSQVDQFMSWWRAQDANLSIRALRSRAEALSEAAYRRASQQLAQGKDPDQVLRLLANTLTNKLLHAPSSGLREAAAAGDADRVELIQQIYQLDRGEGSTKP